MKKTIDCVVAALLAGALPVAAATFPLEWNTTYDTSVPREVEILPEKLVGMGLMREGDGFKVRADGKLLAVKELNGKEPGSVRLRFTVPSGTQALACETCADGVKAGASDGGLFVGALSSAAGWQFKGGTIEKTQNGGHIQLMRPENPPCCRIPITSFYGGSLDGQLRTQKSHSES